MRSGSSGISYPISHISCPASHPAQEARRRARNRVGDPSGFEDREGCMKRGICWGSLPNLGSAAEKRELAAYAESHGIRLGVENVWNRFLLTPREMGQFLTEVGSRSVGLYFDCGNILNYGYPQQWIRELGSSIVKVHVKDFDSSTRQFRHLLQGSVNWKEVRAALLEVGYDDYLTAELPLYPSYPDQMVYDTANHLAR